VSFIVQDFAYYIHTAGSHYPAFKGTSKQKNIHDYTVLPSWMILKVKENYRLPKVKFLTKKKLPALNSKAKSRTSVKRFFESSIPSNSMYI
jgi:hypothetical protein